MTIRIITGHVLDRLRELPGESVHCVVTSPPYYGLRDYGIEPQVWGGDPGCEHDFKTEIVTGEIRTGLGMAALGERYRGGGHKAGEVPKIRAERGFCLRCNAWRGSLGLEPTLDLYLDHMVEIFREVRRVMRKDATCWLNIGDSFFSSTATQGRNETKSRISTLSRHGESGRSPALDSQMSSAYRRSCGNLKPKDLMMIPSRLAIRLQDDGWWVRSDIAWCKRAPIPESCTDRPTTAWEHVFLLTQSSDATYWTHRDHAGTRTKPAPDYRWVDHDNDDAETEVEPPDWRTEPIAKRAEKDYYAMGIPGEGEQRGRREGPLASTPTPHRKRWSRINLWTAHDYFYYKPSKRNLRNFWLLGPSPYPEAHFATFPPEIPRRAILAGTSERGVCPKCGASWERQLSKSIVPRCNIENETIGWQPTCSCAPDHAHCPLGCEHPQPFKDAGDLICGLCWHVHHQRTIMVPCGPDDCDPLLPIPATILDPFLGAGTTALVADQLGRNCIGIELNPQYVAMAERRIHDDAPLLTEIAAE